MYIYRYTHIHNIIIISYPASEISRLSRYHTIGSGAAQWGKKAAGFFGGGPTLTPTLTLALKLTLTLTLTLKLTLALKMLTWCARRGQACHFRKRATSVPAEGPAYGLYVARHCEFPLRALQAQKWHVHGSRTFGAA